MGRRAAAAQQATHSPSFCCDVLTSAACNPPLLRHTDLVPVAWQPALLRVRRHPRRAGAVPAVRRDGVLRRGALPRAQRARHVLHARQRLRRRHRCLPARQDDSAAGHTQKQVWAIAQWGWGGSGGGAAGCGGSIGHRGSTAAPPHHDLAARPLTPSPVPLPAAPQGHLPCVPLRRLPRGGGLEAAARQVSESAGGAVQGRAGRQRQRQRQR